MGRRLQQAEPPPNLDEEAQQAGGVLFFAGEATDDLDPQQVHGAMRSGVRAADQIVERLKALLAAQLD
jgi:predicted NAD/FAD-dependent oxidoreductase